MQKPFEDAGVPELGRARTKQAPKTGNVNARRSKAGKAAQYMFSFPQVARQPKVVESGSP